MRKAFLPSQFRKRGWTNAVPLTGNSSTKIKEFTITRPSTMQTDYSDLKFCVDPNGTTAQKKFLPYQIVSSDASSATVRVSNTSALTSLYYIWGNTSDTNKTDAKSTFGAAGLLYNDFSNKWWDVGKYYRYDLKPETENDFWDNGFKSPFDEVTCIRVYKTGGTHLADDNTYVRFTKSGDRGLTWSTPITIFDREWVSALSKYLVYMNCTCVWFNDGTANGKIIAMANSNISGGTTGENQTYSRAYYVTSSDGGTTWTSPTLTVETSDYTGMGGSAIYTSDGVLFFFGHCDFPLSAPYPYSYCFYSFDDGATWAFDTFTVTNTYLNETTPIQQKSGDSFISQVFCVIRDDGDSLAPAGDDPEKWRKMTITYDTDLETVSLGAIALHDVTTTLKSRPNLSRCFMGYNRPDRIFLLGGTSVIEGWYSDDECTSWTKFTDAQNIADGTFDSSQRTYPYLIPFREDNHDIATILWCSNGSASQGYVQFFDPQLMQFRTVANYTYDVTTPRPEQTADGIKMSYNDTGTLRDPKSLVAIYHDIDLSTTPVKVYGRFKQAAAVNGAFGLKKKGEASGTFANVIVFHSQSNVVYARLSTDGWSPSVTQADDTWLDGMIEVDDVTTETVKFYLGGDLKATKTQSDGNGIPNYIAQLYINMRDNTVGTYDEVDLIWTLPFGDLGVSEGAGITGSWTVRADGLGVV